MLSYRRSLNIWLYFIFAVTDRARTYHVCSSHLLKRKIIRKQGSETWTQHAELWDVLWYHGIIAWLRLEGTLKVIQFQPHAMGRATTHYTRLRRAPSNLALSFFWGQWESETDCCLMCHLFHLGDTLVFERHKQRLILLAVLLPAA